MILTFLITQRAPRKTSSPTLTTNKIGRFASLMFGAIAVFCINIADLQADEIAVDNSDPVPKPITVISTHAIAIRGKPLYPENYRHWNYVNPKAKRGGEITFGLQGTFDNFNRFAQRGSSVANVKEYLYDSLMVGNLDEYSVYYGLIAKRVEYASDYSWISFILDPKAKFQDGKPITSRDVVFTFNKFLSQGVPQFKTYYAGVSVEAIDDHTVKFRLQNPSKEQMMGLCSTTVLPEHIYKDLDLAEPLKSPPLGSGPYKVADFKMGQYIVYQYDENYWAKDHPTNIGINNFSRVRYEYFLDETVLMEAFKKGEYDFRMENVAKNWATQYVGPNFESGAIVKEEIIHDKPSVGMQAYVFNIKRPIFNDWHVRRALNLLFDFEWANTNLFYGQYKRDNSYFRNTVYASSGLPSGRELEILQLYKDELPPEIYTQEYKNSVTDGSGDIRKLKRTALALFKKGGYTLKEGLLVDKNGKQLEFELLIASPSSERVAIPFQKNIASIGGKMNIRLLSDVSQYINRVRERDYDMITGSLGGGAYPSGSLKLEWHSDFLDSSYNQVGTTSPMIDAITSRFETIQEDDAELIAYGRAFDRILLWSYFTIPQYYGPSYRIAYWNKFSHPQIIPKYDLGVETWWYDETKAKRLSQLKTE
jgi:microcin C transport system substrate-binding protein